jgi:hypothetical protein
MLVLIGLPIAQQHRNKPGLLQAESPRVLCIAYSVALGLRGWSLHKLEGDLRSVRNCGETLLMTSDSRHLRTLIGSEPAV